MYRHVPYHQARGARRLLQVPVHLLILSGLCEVYFASGFRLRFRRLATWNTKMAAKAG